MPDRIARLATRHTPYACIIFVLFLSTLIGCQPVDPLVAAGAKASLVGIELCDAALKTYDDIEGVVELDRQQQNFILALTKNTDSQDAPTYPISRQLEPRRAAFRQLRAAYAAMAELTSTDFAKQAGDATTKLTESINALSAIPDLPATVKALAPEVSKLIVAKIQAGKIAHHSEILEGLTKLYGAAWEADANAWKTDYLDHVYSTYSDKITGLPADRFDDKALGEYMKTPFVKVYEISLYKRQIRSESQEKLNVIKREIDSVGHGFDKLTAAHAELKKKQSAIAVVQYYLDVALSILKNVNPNKK